MDYKQYVKKAIRTESSNKELTADYQLFLGAIEIFVAASQIVDLFKRNIFYQKDFDSVEYKNLIAKINILAERTEKNANTAPLNFNPRILHAALGFATESGEILEAIVSSQSNRKLDLINLMEELGDLNWYQAVALDETGLELDDILSKNIQKLQKRFPEKFSNAYAINRDLKTERDTLEGKN